MPVSILKQQEITMKTNLLYRSLIGMLQLLLLVAFSCQQPEQVSTETGHDTTAEDLHLDSLQIKEAGISWCSPQEMEFSETIEIQGILDVPPQNMAAISSLVAGQMISNKWLPGNHVHKGETLCIIQNPDFLQWQEEYMANASKLEFLQAEADRQKDLAAEKATAQKSLQLAVSELVQMKAKQQGLKNKFEMLGISPSAILKGNFTSQIAIKSPIDGDITQIEGKIGQYIQPGDLLFQIVDLSHLHAELFAFEKDLPYIKQGAKVQIILGEQSWPGKVFLINKAVEKDKTIRIHVHFDGEPIGLIPNLAIKGLVEKPGKKSWVLPNQAIRNSGGKALVFVKGKALGKFKQIEVKTGSSNSDFTEILNAESLQGKEIVCKGSESLQAILENPAEGDH